ncbi:double-strand break repair protein AddB [Rhizobiales bacterium]|uniref:double-strand break repair protein AddB n=1 Tax=Hongsoonwoonella zoysiae TaxID=2821844 RepID=UPI00156069CB|nr:double-strand break repair protein AddB [Hongsoonwoonella zoysiae]NRG16470.1 double-strand break repair protein AddB [Hongsoonwoonella zoysiae]
MTIRETSIFTIPPSANFLETLVDALLAGRLVPDFDAGADPLALADITLYLPTRRAARALPEIFRAKLGTDACLLPSIRPLGDVDEDEHALRSVAQAIDLPPEIPAMERLMEMTRLVRAWEGALRRDVLDLPADVPFGAPASAADAAWLAGDLVALMDEVATEEAGWEALASLVPEDHARYWQITLDFLKIATEAWPAHLAERGLMDPKARRSALIRREAEGLRQHPPRGPVIVAGTTGSVPATADLLKAVAGLEKGAIVLPGLDLALDEESWSALGYPGEAASIPAHPQYSLKLLLSRLGVSREDVAPLGASGSPERAARERLVAEALRPAETTDAWPRILASTPVAARLAAFANVSLVEARNEADEALLLATVLREAVEEGKTASLVSPDRTLARRVAVDLARWGIVVDDSAGRPLDQTPPAVLASLAARLALRGLEPVDLLSLLKHPLCRLGLSVKDVRSAARSLERGVLRGPRAAPGTGGLAAAVAASRAEHSSKVARDERIPRWKKLVEDDWNAIEDLVSRLAHALKPLEDFADVSGEVPVEALVEAHVECLARLSVDENGSCDELYAGETGDQLARTLSDMLEVKGSGLCLPAFDWPDVFSAFLSGINVRRRLPGDPRIAILGPLEARLHRPDLVILAGLNEGTWPKSTRNDPWLNRPMKRDLGLDPPERRIGAAAHDFCEGMGAGEVVLSRAARADGAPTVASRWLQRLTTLLGKEVSDAMRRRGERYRRFVSLIDAAEGPVRFAARPEPKPPIAARPDRFSVTEVEALVRDPYAVYARRVLRLDEVDPIGGEPDAAERGQIIHDCLADFLMEWNGPFDEAALARLIEIGAQRFAPLDAFPAVKALWWPRFRRVAQAFIEFEAERAGRISHRHLEIGGGMEIDLTPGRRIRLTGRADRIDELADGTLSIIDYKTGQAPSLKQVSVLLSPQLPLEAVLIRGGGFKGVDAGLPVSELLYVRLSGGRVPLEALPRNPKDRSIAELTDDAEARLRQLLAAYEVPERGYLSRARVLEERVMGGVYDHLARVQEWSLGDGEDA